MHKNTTKINGKPSGNSSPNFSGYIPVSISRTEKLMYSERSSDDLVESQTDIDPLLKKKFSAMV